jgi:putative membrane protein
MKKTSLFSKLFLGAAVVALSLGTASCKGDKPDDSKEAAEEQNEDKFEETSKDSLEGDSDYLVKAAEVDLKEIELGKLAQTKSSNADVKAFGKAMVDAHTKSFEALKKASSAKNISIPLELTEKGSEAYSELNEKTGADFDKAYADKMVDGHKKMIEKMEDAAKNAKDPDIKQWAANMIPELQAHLQHAETVKAKVDAAK